jgi:WD40 repeat protein
VAEAVYDGLDPPGQAHARRILLRLADTEGDRVDVRRRAPQAELAATRAEREVLDTLISGRLLSASEDTVEVAHEALLREWPRLRRWLEEDREGRRLHRQLAQAAIVWDADLRDEADLYRGVRLHAVRDWLATHPDDPNALEQQFINASEAFDATSLRTARRTARRLRVLAASLAILLAAAVIGTWIAIDQRSSARRQALQADVNRLATSATTLSGEQHDLALLLGATAYELQPSDQDAGALQAALMNTPPGLDRIIRYPGPSTSPHLDASGHLLAIPGAGGVVIDNVDTGRQVTVLSWPTSRQYAVFSSDDRFVAAGGSDGTVAVWDAATGAPSGKPVVVGGGTVHAVFDPHDDNRLYVITSNGELTAWDRSDVRNPREVGPQFEGLSSFPAPGTAPDLTISADGRTIAAGGTDINDQPTARMWDTTTGATLHDYPGAVGGFAADNVTLPFGTLGSTVLLDARTGRVTKKIPGTSAAGAPTIGQDGTRLAVAGTHGSTSSVTIYDLASGQRIWHPVTLRSSEFYPLGFLPGGQLVTTGADEATVWTIGKDLPPLGVALDAGVQVSEELDYRFVLPIFVAGWRDVLTVGGGSAWRYDSESGALVGEVPFGVNAPSPDGRLMLDNDGKLWDDRSGKLLSLLKLPPPNVFSAHGYTFAGDESWDPTGHHVAADVGGTGYLWDVSNPQEPSAPRRIGDARLGTIQHLAFMPDGRILVESDGGARLSLIDASSNHTIWNRTISAIAASRRHPDRGTMAHGVVTLRQFAPSPDGSTLALDIGDLSRGRVILLDLSSGAVRGSLVQPTYGGVGYLNHGRWLLVTADAPRPTAQLYDATTLQPFGVPFPTDDVDQERVAVDPAGTRFAQMIEDEANPPLGDDPFLWSVDPARWLRTACAIAGRNLTRAEWHQYLPDRPYRTTCPALPAGS